MYRFIRLHCHYRRFVLGEQIQAPPPNLKLVFFVNISNETLYYIFFIELLAIIPIIPEHFVSSRKYKRKLVRLPPPPSLLKRVVAKPQQLCYK